MKETIAILAPNRGPKDPKGYHTNYVVRYRNGRSHQDLSLRKLYLLAKNDYNETLHESEPTEGEHRPAAGYYLSGLLRQNGYHTIQSDRCDETEIKKIADQSPRVVCVSSTLLLTIDSLNDITYNIRKWMPDAVIVVGGISIWKAYCVLQMGYADNLDDADGQACSMPLMSLFSSTSDVNVDAFVVAPHGGPTLLRVLKEFDKGVGCDLKTIDNLAIPGESGGYHFTDRRDENVDYNHDYIRWDLIDDLPERIPIRTSMGCPHKCGYCDFYTIFPNLHLRSRDGLLAEFEIIKKAMGSESPFTFLQLRDDNALATESRLHELCDIMNASNLTRLSWSSLLRTTFINESNVKLLKKSGLQFATIGVESGDPGQLERMNRKQNLAQVRSAVELLDDAGITTTMSFIVGFPGENDTTLKNTADFINRLSLKKASSVYQLYPMFLLPLANVYRSPELRSRYSINGRWEKWSHYTMSHKDAVAACEKLFRMVSDVPFSYQSESPFFNRTFKADQRTALFRLRKNLTIQIMDGASIHDKTSILTKMVEKMGLADKPPSESFVKNLSVGTCDVSDA